jgi:hypothetical protein
MKLMKTTEAVGQVLCHDITQIIPGVKKDAVFRKGHIITKEDIPVLLSVGKDTIYIWENDETMMHENEAAEVLYRMSACGTKKIEADTLTPVMASISTPVLPTQAVVQIAMILLFFSSSSNSTSHFVIAIG